MSWLIHHWLLVSGVSLLVLKDCRSLFLRHTQSGKCIAAGSLTWIDMKYADRYWAEMVDNCLNVGAQFRYYNELLKNIETGGTFASNGGGRYKNRFVMYKGKPNIGIFENSTDNNLKQTPAGSLYRYEENICAQPSQTDKYVGAKSGPCSNSAEQKFTFGSVTDYGKKMEDVSCSSIQRMLIKKAHYGDFNNNGKFDFNASIDQKCSSLTTCKMKKFCGGKKSCELTIDSSVLPTNYCLISLNTSKEIYTEYTCVDSNNYSTSIITAPNIRLSPSPNKGLIEIKDGLTWRKVNEKNWDKNSEKMLCQHLGFGGTEGNTSYTKELEIGEKIATGDLICYGTESNGTSCCIHLEPSITTSKVNMSYAECKMCDNPLLQNVTTFPDSVFSGSGGFNNYKDARFSTDGWCALGSETKYLLIDLQKEYHITQVVTLGDKNQTKWSGSYSLKYSNNETLVDQSSAVQITGNQNGYQASTTILDIFNARYLKIESTENTDFCLRIEFCGEVQLPSPVENVTAKPSNFSVHLSWTIPGLKNNSSNITHFIIFLDDKEHQTIPREKYGNQFTLRGLKPYTNYTVGIQTQDGSLQKSKIISEFFKTKEAVPGGPPLNVTFSCRGNNSLNISWKPPDKSLWNGELTGYQICISTSDNDENCSSVKSNTFTYIHRHKLPSTKYIVTVAAGTRVGFGKRSLEISKITNGEPVNPVASYYSLAVYIPKQGEYIKEVMVIVQNATSNPIPSEEIETNQLRPYQKNRQDQPYVTAYLKADDLPLTFVIGDGMPKEYKSKIYINQPLKNDSSYIVYLRFFESNISYYSTEWSSLKTLVKSPVECNHDHGNFKPSALSDDETRVDLLRHVPLAAVPFCFLILLVVFIYYCANQRRRHQNNNEQPRERSQASREAKQRENSEPDDSYEYLGSSNTGRDHSYVNVEITYATPDEALGRDERNSTKSKAENSAGQEPSDHMSLNDKRDFSSSDDQHHTKEVDRGDETELEDRSDYMPLNENQETDENVYQPLQHPTSSPDHHTNGVDHRDHVAMEYENLSFDARY